MDLGDEKYVSLTTFTSDGRPKPTPVWIAPLGARQVGFTTASSSWKVRRIRRRPAVKLQASDSKGHPRSGAVVVEGRAEVVSGTEFEGVRGEISRKYGIQFLAISVVGRIARLAGRGSGTDCAVIVTLDE